jgi:hypothetical protein
MTAPIALETVEDGAAIGANVEINTCGASSSVDAEGRYLLSQLKVSGRFHNALICSQKM